MDPIAWRGVERVVIVLGGIAFAYFGYRLYALGVTKGRVNLNAEISYGRIALAGAGPGVVFMGMGAIVLMVATFCGGASAKRELTGGLDEKLDAVTKTVKEEMKLYRAELHKQSPEKFPTMELRRP